MPIPTESQTRRDLIDPALERAGWDLSDPDQAAIWKTVQILLNKVIYADSYLRV